MIRSGDWKLSYYHGLPCQLFNLEEDPRETRDRAEDPGCRETRDRLLDQVLHDWDPESVLAQMAAMREDQHVLRAWAHQVQPSDQYRWPLLSGMDYLDRYQTIAANRRVASANSGLPVTVIWRFSSCHVAVDVGAANAIFVGDLLQSWAVYLERAMPPPVIWTRPGGRGCGSTPARHWGNRARRNG